jgi:hypothetical protein
MIRRSIFIFFVLLTSPLTGCSSLPDLPNDDHVNIADVLYSIRCQLADSVQIYQEKYPWINDWAASTKIQLNVVETGEKSGGANLVVPITNGTFTIGLSAGLTQKATRTATVEASFDLEDINCPDLSGDENPPKYIQGSLGLREWIQRVTAALESSQTLPSSLGYSTNFTLKTNGSLTPSFNVIPGMDRRLGANLKIAGTREDEHSLTITALEKKDKAKKPAKVATRNSFDNKKYQTPAGPNTQMLLNLKGIETELDELKKESD